MISVFMIIILLVILLTVFVGRTSELIIMKIQEKNMRPVMQKKPRKGVYQSGPSDFSVKKII